MLGLQFCGLTGLVIITANLRKYVHVLKIEGELRFYHSTAIIVTQQFSQMSLWLSHYIRTTYKGYVFLSEKFASLLLNTIIKRTLLFIIPKIIQLFVFVEKFVLDLFNVDQFLKFSVSFSLTKNQYKFGEISF